LGVLLQTHLGCHVLSQPQKKKNNFSFVLSRCRTGLPDGIFSNQNHNLGNFWRVLQWKTCAYFWDIWSILQPFGLLYGHWVNFVIIWYFSPVWYVVPRKIWQPCCRMNPVLGGHLNPKHELAFVAGLPDGLFSNQKSHFW
jgi:hypothetical protein